MVWSITARNIGTMIEGNTRRNSERCPGAAGFPVGAASRIGKDMGSRDSGAGGKTRCGAPDGPKASSTPYANGNVADRERSSRAEPGTGG